MSLIGFTILNRKTIVLLSFLILALICYIVPTIFQEYGPLDIDLLDFISQILVTVPYFIRKFKLKKKIFKIELSAYSKQDYLIFSLMIILNLLNTSIYLIFNDTLNFLALLLTRTDIELLIIITLSKYVLNFKIYNHHIVGFSFLIFSAIINDYYIIKYSNKNENYIFNFNNFIIIIFYTIFEGIVLTYKKYLIDVKYFSPYVVCFIFGFCNFIYIIILIIINKFYECFFGFEGKCVEFFPYEYENNIHFFLSIIIYLIAAVIIFYLNYQVIYYFYAYYPLLVNYIDIFFENIKMANKINKNALDWIINICSNIILLFGLLTSIEIIELNFCDLNKNIRRKISERGNPPNEELIKLEEVFEENEDRIHDDKEEEKDKIKNKIEVIPGYMISI